MNKKVRITIEMDNEFLGLLKAECGLKGLGFVTSKNYIPHTPTQVIGLLAMMEGIGLKEEAIHADIPIEWRPHIRVIHKKREVIKE